MDSLRCPECGSARGRVIATREIRWKRVFFLMRIRECGHCKYQYRSKEITDDNIVQSHKNKPEETPQPTPQNDNHDVEQQIEAAKAEETRLKELEPLPPTLDSPFPQEVLPKISNIDPVTGKKKRGRPRKEIIREAEGIFPPME